MARYIDADLLEKQLNRYVEYSDDGEQEINVDAVFITLHEQPTADVVERKKGEWQIVKNADGATHDYRCSACHRYRFHNGEMRNKYKFCPNCGADMRGEKDVEHD